MEENQYCSSTRRVFISAIGFALLVGTGSAPASAATILRSADVDASASEVWSLIGPFCAIKNWLPPVGQCIEDGKSPATRILVTKDGNAAFVETQTARDNARHSYSYRFLSSPLPVSKYTSTISVSEKGDGTSTIAWSGSYVPEHGKENAAYQALSAVYEMGLAQIKEMLDKKN